MKRDIAFNPCTAIYTQAGHILLRAQFPQLVICGTNMPQSQIEPKQTINTSVGITLTYNGASTSQPRRANVIMESKVPFLVGDDYITRVEHTAHHNICSM